MTEHAGFGVWQPQSSPAAHLEGIHPQCHLLGQAQRVKVHLALHTRLLQHGIPSLVFINPDTPGAQQSEDFTAALQVLLTQGTPKISICCLSAFNLLMQVRTQSPKQQCSLTS